MGKRLIDANDLLNHIEDYFEGQSKYSMIDPYYVRNAETIFTIPENPTNGDMIKALFPDEVDFENDFDADWWNAPYK